MTANTVRSRKSKGRTFQNDVLKKIKDNFNLSENDIRTVPSSVQGMDIWLSEYAQKVFPFSVECKRTEKLNLWSSIEQAEINAKKLNPLLIFKRNRGKIYACLEFEVLLKFILHNNESITTLTETGVSE